MPSTFSKPLNDEFEYSYRVPVTATPGSTRRTRRTLGSLDNVPPIPTPCTGEKADTPASVKKLSLGGVGGHGGKCVESGWNLASPIINKDNEETTSSEPTKPPTASRSIIENQPLVDTIEGFCVCRKCGHDISVSFDTCCLATAPILKCRNVKCLSIAECSREETSLADNNNDHKKIYQYAINVQFVLAMIASGDGGAELGRLLGLLDLPNYASMEKKSFGNIERSISEVIVGITKEALDENLAAEVRLQMEGDPEFDFDEWNRLRKLPPEERQSVPTGLYAKVNGGADMAWQKRSSGRRHDSSSGHETIVGMKTRKPIAMALKCKMCKICSLARGKKEEPREHNCTINHVGSSGSMESEALLDMTHRLYYDNLVSLHYIVTDDDSTMKAKLRWDNKDYYNHHKKHRLVEITRGKHKGEFRKADNKGKLQYPVPEPFFVADASHRKKTFRNHLYSYNGLSKKKKHGFSEADVMRLTTNFSYFIRSLQNLPKEEWEDRAKAVLDHHFDDHTHCGEWCDRKKELFDPQYKPSKDKVEMNKVKHYRSKKDEKELYDDLKEIIDDFIHPTRLREVGHPYNTQVNECMNNTIAWLAPKNKHYSGSFSLLNRVSIGVAMHLLGPEKLFQILYERIGMICRPGTLYYLKQQQKALDCRRASQQLTSTKRKRNEDKFEKLRKLLLQLKNDKKNNNYYESGVGMGCDKSSVVSDDPKVCSTCGGHDCSDNRCREEFVEEANNGRQQSMLDLIPLLDDDDIPEPARKKMKRITNDETDE